MFWIALRCVIFLVVAGTTWFVLALAAVFAAGEVSCYEVCSPVTLWLERAAPWPAIVSLIISAAVGWFVSWVVSWWNPSRR